MWFIQPCKMCINVKTTLFSWMQSYPFLFTPGVFFYGSHFSSCLTWGKVTPECFVRKKSNSYIEVGSFFYVDKWPQSLFCGGNCSSLHWRGKERFRKCLCFFSVVFSDFCLQKNNHSLKCLICWIVNIAICPYQP